MQKINRLKHKVSAYNYNLSNQYHLFQVYIKFVSHLRQVDGFPRVLTTTI
jgi:hypothetical protein